MIIIWISACLLWVKRNGFQTPVHSFHMDLASIKVHKCAYNKLWRHILWLDVMLQWIIISMEDNSHLTYISKTDKILLCKWKTVQSKFKEDVEIPSLNTGQIGLFHVLSLVLLCQMKLWCFWPMLKLFLSAGPELSDTASTTEKLWEGFSHRSATSTWFITSGVKSDTSIIQKYCIKTEK